VKTRSKIGVISSSSGASIKASTSTFSIDFRADGDKLQHLWEGNGTEENGNGALK